MARLQQAQQQAQQADIGNAAFAVVVQAVGLEDLGQHPRGARGAYRLVPAHGPIARGDPLELHSGDTFGFETPFILADKFWVIPAIMLVITWKYFGFHMMIFIAGLQSIPGEVIEAARLDGVKKWQIVRHIKLPMVRSAIVISVFFAITGALQLFDIIIPLTNGGPSHSSHTIVTFLYQFGILRMNLGFGGAVSVLLFIACVVVALAYRRILFRVEQN